jgi:glycosyltransferase involved in cell wall biosynthesis
MIPRLTRALAAAKPDVLHTHVHVLPYALPYVWYASRSSNRPIMLHTVHSLAEFEVEPRLRWVQKAAFRCGVVPVAVAQEVAVSLERIYGIRNPRVVANCLPVKRYRTPNIAPFEWRSREGFSGSDFLFVCVAGLRPEKNHRLLIEAFARVATGREDVHLVLAGGGDRSHLQAYAEQLGVGPKVRFLGVRTDIPDVLAASDAFVLASKYEGNPLCIMEAMAAGLPVVAPSVGGIPELVSSGVEGILVPPGDADALSAAMQTILENANLRSAMGRASGRRASETFDIQNMIRGYESLYDALRARPGNLHSTPRMGQVNAL